MVFLSPWKAPPTASLLGRTAFGTLWRATGPWVAASEPPKDSAVLEEPRVKTTYEYVQQGINNQGGDIWLASKGFKKGWGLEACHEFIRSHAECAGDYFQYAQ